MKQRTIRGRVKEVPTAPYKLDWNGKQGSKFSAEVLAFLRPYWKHDVVLAEWPVVGTKLRYDYVNLTRSIICETDGKQHDQLSKHFHSNIPDKYLLQIKHDLEKDEIAEANGFKVIRIKPRDLPLTHEFFKTKFDITL